VFSPATSRRQPVTPPSSRYSARSRTRPPPSPADRPPACARGSAQFSAQASGTGTAPGQPCPQLHPLHTEVGHRRAMSPCLVDAACLIHHARLDTSWHRLVTVHLLDTAPRSKAGAGDAAWRWAGARRWEGATCSKTKTLQIVARAVRTRLPSLQCALFLHA
jgi:hypothetical protein